MSPEITIKIALDQGQLGEDTQIAIEPPTTDQVSSESAEDISAPTITADMLGHDELTLPPGLSETGAEMDDQDAPGLPQEALSIDEYASESEPLPPLPDDAEEATAATAEDAILPPDVSAEITAGETGEVEPPDLESAETSAGEEGGDPDEVPPPPT